MHKVCGEIDEQLGYLVEEEMVPEWHSWVDDIEDMVGQARGNMGINQLRIYWRQRFYNFDVEKK